LENVILVPQKDPSAARALLDSFCGLAESAEIELRAAAVVERHPDGRWHFPEETAQPSYHGTITSGALGALIGLLAGPAGLLLGGTAGLLIGSSVEIGDAEDAEAILHALPRMVPPGATALLADVYETGPDAVDRAVKASGATALRIPRTEVERELAAAEKQLEQPRRR
jgi:uncharacterized membrane protein